MKLLLLLVVLLAIVVSSAYLYYRIQPQPLPLTQVTESLEEQFGREIAVSSGDWTEEDREPIFDNQPVSALPQKYEDENFVDDVQKDLLVLGVSTPSAKRLEVNLTEQKIYAWQGDRIVYEFPVSTGRPGYETPTGDFTVWRKVKYQVYRGGTPGTSTYYNLPNVPYSLFFTGDKAPKYKGYAVHGAYWHDDFGIKRRSSGCVNLPIIAAGKIYHWAFPIISDGINAINSTEDNQGIKVAIHY